MTTDLEKRFFDTFGIEPYDRYYNCKDNLEGECKLEHTCCCCDKSEYVYCYPEITDHILLKLICIANKYGVLPYTTTIKNLKDRTLRILIKVQKYREKYLPESNSTIKLPKTIRKIFKECE